MNKADKSTFPCEGLTKREYFAAMALQGILANIDTWNNELVATWSVEVADALLRKLEESK